MIPGKEDFENFKLSANAKHSPGWAELMRWATYELSVLRLRNDNAILTEIQTAELRGQIKAFKRFIALGEDPSPRDAGKPVGHGLAPRPTM